MTKLAISILIRENVDWFAYIYNNYKKFIAIDFLLIVNAVPGLYEEIVSYIEENNIQNVILSEPFHKIRFSTDMLLGHMLNLKKIEKDNSIDYVTFFASNVIFFKHLNEIDETHNSLIDKYFTKTLHKTSDGDSMYPLFTTKLGTELPLMHVLNTKFFEPETKEFIHGWISNVTYVLNEIKLFAITCSEKYDIMNNIDENEKNNFYWGQIEGLTARKEHINHLISYYWENNHDKAFKMYPPRHWVFEEFYPQTFLIKNNYPLFYLTFNGSRDMDSDIKCVTNKPDHNFYGLKINSHFDRTPENYDIIINALS